MGAFRLGDPSIWGKWFAPLSKARRLALRTNAGLL